MWQRRSWLRLTRRQQRVSVSCYFGSTAFKPKTTMFITAHTFYPYLCKKNQLEAKKEKKREQKAKKKAEKAAKQLRRRRNKRPRRRKTAEAKAQKIREAESTLKALEMKKKNAMTEKSSAASIKSVDSEIAIAQKKLAGLKK